MAEYRVLLTDYAWPNLDLERSVLSDVGAETRAFPGDR